MLGKLEAMSDLFNTNVRWDSSHPICYLGDPASLDLARSEIVVSYTEAEERWMYKMNDRFEDCFSQVNCGKRH